MTAKTALTDAEIIAIGHQASSIEVGENGYILPIAFARAIEQAVLQSSEIQELRDVLDRCRFALEPYDDVKPRDWKTDRENLRNAHQAVCAALAAAPKFGEEAMNQLFCDLKTDEEKSNFFLMGRGYETGIIAKAIQNDVAMAYHRCAEYEKEVRALRKDAERLDWLADPKNNLGKVQLPRVCVERNLHSLRDAIDDAMEQMK